MPRYLGRVQDGTAAGRTPEPAHIDVEGAARNVADDDVEFARGVERAGQTHGPTGPGQQQHLPAILGTQLPDRVPRGVGDHQAIAARADALRWAVRALHRDCLPARSIVHRIRARRNPRRGISFAPPASRRWRHHRCGDPFRTRRGCPWPAERRRRGGGGKRRGGHEAAAAWPGLDRPVQGTVGEQSRPGVEPVRPAVATILTRDTSRAGGSGGPRSALPLHPCQPKLHMRRAIWVRRMPVPRKPLPSALTRSKCQRLITGSARRATTAGARTPPILSSPPLRPCVQEPSDMRGRRAVDHEPRAAHIKASGADGSAPSVYAIPVGELAWRRVRGPCPINETDPRTVRMRRDRHLPAYRPDARPLGLVGLSAAGRGPVARCRAPRRRRTHLCRNPVCLCTRTRTRPSRGSAQ